MTWFDLKHISKMNCNFSISVRVQDALNRQMFVLWLCSRCFALHFQLSLFILMPYWLVSVEFLFEIRKRHDSGNLWNSTSVCGRIFIRDLSKITAFWKGSLSLGEATDFEFRVEDGSISNFRKVNSLTFSFLMIP